MTDLLCRLRWLFCGYAAGCFLLLVLGHIASGFGILVLSRCIHYGASIRKRRQIYSRQKKIFLEQSHLRTIDFYLRGKRNVAMANPLPETHRVWGERSIHKDQQGVTGKA